MTAAVMLWAIAALLCVLGGGIVRAEGSAEGSDSHFDALGVTDDLAKRVCHGTLRHESHHGNVCDLYSGHCRWGGASTTTQFFLFRCEISSKGIKSEPIFWGGEKNFVGASAASLVWPLSI